MCVEGRWGGGGGGKMRCWGEVGSRLEGRDRGLVHTVTCPRHQMVRQRWHPRPPGRAHGTPPVHVRRGRLGVEPRAAARAGVL